MTDPGSVSAAVERVFLEQRGVLLAFLRSRNVGDAAEDLLQEMWVRLPRDGAQVHAPMSYLYRMANSLVIDRHRREGQARRRERAWTDAVGSTTADHCEQPAADRMLVAREMATEALAVLTGQGERVARVFRRHRIDGLTQREVADELGVSIGTVEGDLRRGYRALLAFRERYDEA